MLKYNENYDRWVSEDGLIYRKSSKQDKLILCKQTKLKNNYLVIQISKPNRKLHFSHRIVYETFVGEIPKGFEIDHINTIRTDNRLENLRIVTRSENMLNPITRKHQRDSHLGIKYNRKKKTK